MKIARRSLLVQTLWRTQRIRLLLDCEPARQSYEVRFCERRSAHDLAVIRNRSARLGTNALTRERAGMRDLNEGQKISYDVVADKRTGKSSADNLKPA